MLLERLEQRHSLASIGVVGHRIVHGGPRLDRATLVTSEVVAELHRWSALDPEHLPAALSIVEAMGRVTPSIPQVASFDTAFHRTMPRVAKLLPIPHRYEALGVRRYGFHGLSYAFLTEEVRRVAGDAAARGRIVLSHLGSGSSLAAVRDGRSVDTTMGFTPTSGLMMGTRSGDMDPGVLIYLLRTERMGVDEIDALLNRQSGLRGVSETSSDMRDLLARESTDARAADAIALFCYQARKGIGAMAAALGGIDTLVFSGGIGARAPSIRKRIALGLDHLAVSVDDSRNEAGDPVISLDGSGCTVRAIDTDEESVIAGEAIAVILAGERDGAPRAE